MKINKLKIALGILLGLTLSSNLAFASMICSANAVVENKITSTVNMKIPSNGAISSTVNLNTYKVSINCDLHSEPNSLEILIVSPNDDEKSTDSDSELGMLDNNGNGVLVSCEYQ